MSCIENNKEITNWIENHNKEIVPEEGKIYWVTCRGFCLDKGYVDTAKYSKGEWFSVRGYGKIRDVIAWFNFPQPNPFPIENHVEGLHFPDFEVGSNGVNSKIKVTILPKEIMKHSGFTKEESIKDKEYWLMTKNLYKDIFLYIKINDNNPDDFKIDVIDDTFCQVYDYQSILEKDKNHRVANIIKSRMENIMSSLSNVGIISGHVNGEYI